MLDIEMLDIERMRAYLFSRRELPKEAYTLPLQQDDSG